jgi:hypothetical protein
MRFGKLLIMCGVLAASFVVGPENADAQIVRRSPLIRARSAQQRKVTPSTNSATTQNRNMISAKVVQLSPMVAPAIGPSGAQGVGSVFYNDVDTSLNSGNLVITGLPQGRYYVWLVFFDPFKSGSSSRTVHSELVAKFNVFSNSARTETSLMIGLPNVINISHAKQLVVTRKVKTDAEVGGKPVNGAAGYRRGPGYKEAVLAANIN